MLDKDFDTAIIGTTPYAYLLGIELLFSHQRVVLISPPEDESRSFHEGTGPVTQLEVAFMKHWGEVRGIESLKNLDQYLAPLDVIISSGDKKVWLGQGTSEFLTEILRKFQDIFKLQKNTNGLISKLINNKDPEAFRSSLVQFETEFANYLKILIEKSYKIGNFKKFNLNMMLSDAPLFIKEFYENFKSFSAWNKPFESNDLSSDLNIIKIQQNFNAFWEFKSFLYSARTLFHKTSQIVSSDFEIFHTLVQLFSKVYTLDSKNIISDLKAEYFKLGGMYKETPISDWDCSSIGPWNIELGSYDGVIRPKKIILMGHLLPRSELQSDPSKSFYYRLPFETELHLNSENTNYDLFSSQTNWILCHSDAQQLGTDYPYFSIRFDTKNYSSENSKIKIFGEMWWKYQDGARAEFFKPQIESKLRDILSKQSFATYEILSLSLKTPRKWPVWQDFEKTKLNQCIMYDPGILGLPKVNTLNSSETIQDVPSLAKKISKIKYFGPEKREVLGPFSTLLDIKSYCSEFSQ